jgi:hypothetical protein
MSNNWPAPIWYPTEVLDPDYDDDGTMPDNVDQLRQAVVGHRIVKTEKRDDIVGRYYNTTGLIITLDDGTEVRLADTDDCCAYTSLEAFWLHPDRVDHMILGVGTTEGYTRWHIYADWGDVLELEVGWSAGNPFYYGYGFHIDVVPVVE